MEPMVALVVSVMVAGVFFASRVTRTPSRFILAEPTTIWPVASLGAGVGLAVAAVIMLVSLGVGWIAFIIGVVILFAMASVGQGAANPKRLIYERGGKAILRSQVIVTVVIFCVLWAFLSQ